MDLEPGHQSSGSDSAWSSVHDKYILCGPQFPKIQNQLCGIRQLLRTEGFPGSSAGKESTCNAGDPGSTPALGRSTAEGIGYAFQYSLASLVAQLVKNLPAMWETWVQFPGLGRSPGEGKGYPLQYSGLQNSIDYIIHRVAKSRHHWVTHFHFPVLAIITLNSFSLRECNWLHLSL